MLGICACKSRYLEAASAFQDISAWQQVMYMGIPAPRSELVDLVIDVRMRVLSVVRYPEIYSCRFTMSCAHVG